jgi:hypothetical protein
MEKMKYLKMAYRSDRLCQVFRAMERQRKAEERQQRQDSRKQLLASARCVATESESESLEDEYGFAVLCCDLFS